MPPHSRVGRGPGEVLGTAQSGLPDRHFPEFLNDSALVKRARDLARQMRTLSFA